jgi:hypothetical protein
VYTFEPKVQKRGAELLFSIQELSIGNQRRGMMAGIRIIDDHVIFLFIPYA